MADNEPATSAGPDAPAAETLGQRLRNARLAQELTVEQIATELRIEAKQLHALEDDRLEQIGIPVFVKGYLKQYGHRLGVDVRDLLALYYRQTQLADVQIQPNRTIKLRDERQIAGWVLAAIVLFAVVVGLAVWWWNGGSFDVLRTVTRATTPPPASTAVPAAAREPEPVATAPSPAAADTDTDTEADADAEASVAAAPVGAVEPAAGPALTAPEDAGRVFIVPLELAFDGESWAEVTDGRGERLVYGLQAAGRRLTVRGTPPFAVVLGNASGARLTVDGEPYDIPPTRRDDNLVRFSVDIAEE